MPASSLRRGDILRIRDERWTVWRHVTHASASVVDVRGCDRTNRGVRARFLLPFEPFERLPLTRATQVVTARQWRHRARQVLADATPSYDSLRTAARADIDLLPFQLEPALAVVRGLAARILIADEVGLGKTVQAGIIVAETLDRCAAAHVLIVTPSPLREQWCGELQRRFGLDPVVMDSEALRDGGAAPAGANPWTAQPLIVTSVDYVKRPEALRSLETLVWDLVIVDEAHGLSGRSDRNAALTLLGERARTLVLLTATPHSGDEAAFARMCAVGDLDGAFPLLVFRRTRQDAGLPSARRTTWLTVATTAAEAAMHRALTTYARLVWRQRQESSAAARLVMLVLLRRAGSSASSLARSIERRLSLLCAEPDVGEQLGLPLGFPGADDEEPGSELGAPGLADVNDERLRLEEILALARRAQSRESKLQAVRRLLRRAGDPAIVFTEYRDTLAPLAAALHGSATVQLHGGLSASERRHVLAQFDSGAASVLLATDAASEGLNLQHRCRLVVNLELPWTPTRLEQRAGRVDRLGQRRRVHAVHLVAAGTGEESTVAALLRRMDRVQGVFHAMRPGTASGQEIARGIIGEDDPAAPADAATVSLPPGLIVTDLRGAAVLEVERASATRALAARSSGVSPVHRPFVTSHRRIPPRDYWAFRLEFTDADDELIWETLVGLGFDAGCPVSRRRREIRARADSFRAALAGIVHHTHDALRADVIAALRQPIALATLREEAIVAAANRRHGRLAAGLVQRGLFDRRTERAAGAQDAALHEMVGRCRARLAQLARRRVPRMGGCEPVFAVVRG